MTTNTIQPLPKTTRGPDWQTVCSIDDCDAIHYGRGWCKKHYERWRKFGDPHHYPYLPFEQAFWSKVDFLSDSHGCWLWLAGKDRNGYGSFNRRYAGTGLAHRIAYEVTYGPVDPKLSLDHLCRNTSCVNPNHLEPVTQRENILRGASPMARHARQTHCLRGHPYDEANTRHYKGGRICRACHNENEKARRSA
jgi:hypothetical protein